MFTVHNVFTTQHPLLFSLWVVYNILYIFSISQWLWLCWHLKEAAMPLEWGVTHFYSRLLPKCQSSVTCSFPGGSKCLGSWLGAILPILCFLWVRVLVFEKALAHNLSLKMPSYLPANIAYPRDAILFNKLNCRIVHFGKPFYSK